MKKPIKIHVTENIMQKGRPATAGSKILSGFVAPFDAAVVERLNAAGIAITDRLPMDEFGIDGLFSADETLLPAIRTVMTDADTVVLCSDLFGKLRRQAAANGLCHIQPTYGTVSRYGLIPGAPSMDQIGILCAEPDTGFEILKIITGKDAHDGAMRDEAEFSSAVRPEKDKVPEKSTIWYPENVWVDRPPTADMDIQRIFTKRTGNLKFFDIYHHILYILAAAEICASTNRYDGVSFGHRSADSGDLQALYLNSRGEGFTVDTKQMIIMGASVLSQENYGRCYEKALKIRRLIKESLTFDDYDLIALPTNSDKSKYEQTALFALTALAGLPALIMPQGGGVQYIANAGREDVLSAFAKFSKSWEEGKMTV